MVGEKESGGSLQNKSKYTKSKNGYGGMPNAGRGTLTKEELWTSTAKRVSTSDQTNRTGSRCERIAAATITPDRQLLQQ